MAHLTKMQRYNIEDSNIALLGSDIEKRVREHAGDKEPAWEDAGKEVSTQIWRIEHFKVVPWPKERYGTFYNGDSYIVLHTYKEDPNSNELFYNLHFWLGEETTQDEAGTAAYKTVELDDHLHGLAVQYREVQGHESPQFALYFSHFTTLHGGVSTGFHHITALPPPDLHKLYHIKAVASDGDNNHHHGGQLIIRQVRLDAESVRQTNNAVSGGGGVLVLDKGSHIWQFNRKNSAGRERFKAAEYVRSMVEERQTHNQFEPIDVRVCDEGESGTSLFLEELGLGIDDVSTTASGTVSNLSSSSSQKEESPSGSRTGPTIYRVSDATGALTVTPVRSDPPTRLSDLESSDIYLVDDTENWKEGPVVYVWIGKKADGRERRIGMEIAQRYLHRKENTQAMRTSVVKVIEGRESNALLRALKG